MKITTTQYLFNFEKEIIKLLGGTKNYIAFMSENPSMRDAIWTIAHFNLNQKSVDKAALDWYNECVKPMLTPPIIKK